MRILNLLGVIGLMVVTASCVIRSRRPAPAPAHHPPPHAPAHGVRAQVRYTYYYYPNAKVYYCPTRRIYFHLVGGTWRSSATRPVGITLGSHVSLDLDVDRPHVHHSAHVAKYPPGQAKKVMGVKGPAQPKRYNYYYYPASQVYYCPTRRLYFHLSGGTWRTSATIPIGITLGSRVSLDLDVDRPHLHHATHKAKYPPGQVKKATGVKVSPGKPKVSPGKPKVSPGKGPKKPNPGRGKGKKK